MRVSWAWVFGGLRGLGGGWVIWMVCCEGGGWFFLHELARIFHEFQNSQGMDFFNSCVIRANSCKSGLGKVVHARVGAWCLGGLTVLCGSLCSLCNCFLWRVGVVVALEFVPGAAGEIGDFHGGAAGADGAFGEFDQTGPFGGVVDVLVEGEAVAETID